MRVTADTNVLVRAFLEDHPQQSKVAQAALSKAELIAVTMATLCEFVWVLRSYKIDPSDIATTIRSLINGANVAVNRPAAEAGLALLTRVEILRMALLLMTGAGLAQRPSSPSTEGRQVDRSGGWLSPAPFLTSASADPELLTP